MTVDLEKSVMALPREERAALAQKLLASVQKMTPEAEQAWKDELLRRKQAYEAGKMETVTKEYIVEKYLS